MSHRRSGPVDKPIVPLFISNDSFPLSPSRARFQLRPSIRWCYVALAPAMIFILAGLDRSYQTDLWHHLARGREILRTHMLVNRDIFTFTLTGEPLIDNNWLTQIAATKLYAIGGINLLQSINALLLAMAAALTVSSAMRLGASARAAGLTAAAMVGLLAPTLLIRPQTMSILLFALLLRVLIEARRRPSWLIAAPLIVALWANVHGAFPIGVALIACFAAGESLRLIRPLRERSPVPTPGQRPGFFDRASAHRLTPLHWLLASLAAALAMLASPYGWRVFTYVRQTSLRSTGRSIQEWLPPDLHTLSGAAWLASIFFVLTITVIRRRQLRPWMVFALLAFAGLSVTSVRMGIWWSLTAAAIVPGLLARRVDAAAAAHRLFEQERSEAAVSPFALIASSFAASFLLAAMLAACVLSLPAMQRFNPIFRRRPSDRVEDSLAVLTADIAAESPHARVYSRLEWGEYLSFALPWQPSVFLDGRIEIVPDDVWDEYRRVTSAAADWQAILDRYGVTVLLLDRHYHDGLIAAASSSSRWREAETAGTGVIFIRRN